MVLCRDDEDDDVDFLLASKDGSCLETVTIETGGVDERDIDETVIEEGLGRGPGIGEIDLDDLLCGLVVSDDILELGEGALGVGGRVVRVVLDAWIEDVDLL